MMIDEIFIDVVPGETRVALTANDLPVEVIYHRDGQSSLVDNVYLGRVARVLDGLQAAFIDIGAEQTGFLGLGDARPRSNRRDEESDKKRIGDFVTEGTAIIVQVTKDPLGDKGPRLTTNISLPGHYCVFTPFSPTVGISRQITDEETRDRLRDIFSPLRDEGQGYVVRTLAAEADATALTEEAGALREQWEAIRRKRINAKAPAALFAEEDPLPAILRDHVGDALKRVVCDNGETLTRVKNLIAKEMPNLSVTFEHHTGATGLFEAEGINEAIDGALEAETPLPDGGSLIIEQAAALTVIDVNSGGRTDGNAEHTARVVNLDAVPEIARQIRLRNLCGQILIDFITMKKEENRQAVEAAFSNLLDSATHLHGFTKLGLMELTRKRKREPLRDILTIKAKDTYGGRVKSPETLAFENTRRKDG